MPCLAKYDVHVLFAQEAAPEPGLGWSDTAGATSIGDWFFVLFHAHPAGAASKQNRHRGLLENLKKNDRVVTAGGIKGISLFGQSRSARGDTYD